MFEFEGIYTLVKSLEKLPAERQEEFLMSQEPQEGDEMIYQYRYVMAFTNIFTHNSQSIIIRRDEASFGELNP